MDISDFVGGGSFDFNKTYEGYYEPCEFTAFAATSQGYKLAGVDKKGKVHLFSSCRGRVWEEILLCMTRPFEKVRILGTKIIKILEEEPYRQLYLICEGGEIAVLPDCPRCIRITEESIPQGSKIIDAHFSTIETGVKVMDLFLDNKEKKAVFLSSLRQYRIAVSFAEKLMEKGGTIIDVRPGQGEIPGNWEKGIHIPLEELDAYLEGAEKDAVMLFYCSTGLLADEAASDARRMGFYNAYSLGGIREWAHI